MSRDRENRPREELPYRVYRAGARAPQPRKGRAPSSRGESGDGIAPRNAWRAPAGRPATAAGGRSGAGASPRSAVGSEGPAVRSGAASGAQARAAARSEPAERPYRTYRSKPLALRSRLRGEEDLGDRRGGGRRPRGPAAGGRRL